MRISFTEQLNLLHNEMIDMGEMIEKAIEKAIDALDSGNVEKAKEVIDNDIYINEQEKKIEDLCFNILLRQQPVASDLKMISGVLKMVTDMERIGDHAQDISELAIILSDRHTYVPDYIRDMAKESTAMLIESIDAYVNKDIEKAKKVVKQDDVVDKLFIIAKNQLIETIREDAGRASIAADLLMVAKYLERVGDHATNIAEWAIYSIN